MLVHPTSWTEVRVSVDPATLAGSASVASTSKRHPTFTFDRVLGEQSSQIDLYNVTARERIEEFLRGFNVTFLAYGQTSSGKSYSMGTTGDEEDYLDLSDHSRAGLIPRTVEQVFRRAEEVRLQSGPGASWECRVSFLELYNEDLIDLLSNTNMPVSIRENQDGRIVWSGVREIKVANVSEVMQLLSEGSKDGRDQHEPDLVAFARHLRPDAHPDAPGRQRQQRRCSQRTDDTVEAADVCRRRRQRVPVYHAGVHSCPASLELQQAHAPI